jgi:uncharacterized membrane protein YphA (DoxX/SURF4 family)
LSARVRDVIGLLARVVLGGTLVVAGALKVGDPGGSIRAVNAYQLLPLGLAEWVGYALPYLEMAVGLLLVAGLFTRTVAAVAGLLMAAFVFGISWAWAKGLQIDCGCFGGGGTVAAGETSYGLDLVRDGGLLLLAVWLVVRPHSLLSLDRHWLGLGTTTTTTEGQTA